jgi:murein DD-endopeptidase MepM/ murein hydrolase activator NlpD
VRIRADASGRLEELVARFAAIDTSLAATHFTRLRVTRLGETFTATLETAALATQIRLGSGTIRSSLFAATDEANIPDAIATQLAEVFATDIDFHRELRKGDTFSVVYEALTADGEPVNWSSSTGRMLAAEFVNNGRTESALWFQDDGGKGAYYGLDGRSKRRAFLASPLEFSRVTSGFAMRLHPIFNNWRQHNGIDYGAPQGTPVRSVGDAKVEFAGWRNGYGNVVELQHGGGRETVYAHLSRIDVRVGQRVEQGERIGAVGRTGWATGPHLHFEFKVGGAHEDPAVIAKSAESATLSASARAAFRRWSASMKGQLDVAGSVVDTRAE